MCINTSDSLHYQKTDFKNPYIYIYYSINYNIYFKLNIDIIDTNTDNQLVTRHKIDTSMSKNDTRVQIIK